MAGLWVLLEDDHRRRQKMIQLLADVIDTRAIRTFDNASDMNRWLKQYLNACHVLLLDDDLGPMRLRDGQSFDPGSGWDVVDWVVQRRAQVSVLIHGSNKDAADGMRRTLEREGWPVGQVAPYGDLEWLEALWKPALLRLLNHESKSR